MRRSTTALQRLSDRAACGLVFAVLAGMFLARRMVGPIQALRAGAARIGSGDLGQRISIKTGDELEGLADQFNDMAGGCRNPMPTWRRRSRSAPQSCASRWQQQTATSEVLQVISRARLANWSRCSHHAGERDAALRSQIRRHAALRGRRLIARALQLFAAAGLEYNAVIRGRDVAHRGSEHDSARVANLRDRSSTSPTSLPTSELLRYAETVDAGRHSHIAHRADAQGGRAGRGDRHLPPGGATIHRQADRAGSELRRPGRHRHRECPAAQRNAARTDELGRSVEELRALGEVTQAVNSTLDLETVLATIVAKAVQLSGTEAGAIYVFDEAQQRIPAARHLRHGRGADRSDQRPTDRRRSRLMQRGRCGSRTPAGSRPARGAAPRRSTELILRAGYRALLVVPLLGPDRIVGALVVRRARPASSDGHGRPAADLRRAVGAGDPERPPVPRDRGEEPAARGREPAQVAVPRQHEPRAAHAAQRHPRLHRADPRRHLWRAAGEDAQRCSSACRATASICLG